MSQFANLADDTTCQTGRPAGAAAVPSRPRVDATTFIAAQQLLLRGVHMLAALLAVAGLAALSGMPGELLTDLRPWLVLLPAAAALAPVRQYRTLGHAAVARWLRVLRASLNAVVCVLAVQGLVWAAGASPLDGPRLVGLAGLLALACWVGRWLLEQGMRPWGGQTRLLVVGAGEHGVATVQHFRAHEPEVEVVGFVDDRQTRIDANSLPAPLLGTTASVAGQSWDIDGVVIALPNSAGERVHALATALRSRCGNVYLAPELPVLRHALARRSRGGPHKLVLLGMDGLPLWGRICKRSFDVCFSALALLAFLPFGLVIAALIKLESPGPVFFVQQRHGLGNRLFGLIKFRSMTHDPQRAGGEIRLTERGDRRVTRIGHFLRRTSLDEFPQFLNVLRGDMSVVGPRPHPPGVRAGDRVYEAVVDEFPERYKVRPGITGWAQVHGLRGNTFTEAHLTQRFAFDVQYIQNWSVELDLWIVLRTALGGFRGGNAF